MMQFAIDGASGAIGELAVAPIDTKSRNPESIKLHTTMRA